MVKNASSGKDQWRIANLFSGGPQPPPRFDLSEISWHDLQCMAGLQKGNLTQIRLVVPCFTNPRGMMLKCLLKTDQKSRERERDPSVCLRWGSSNRASVRPAATEVICEARNVVRMRSESEWEQQLKKKLMKPSTTSQQKFNQTTVNINLRSSLSGCEDSPRRQLG